MFSEIIKKVRTERKETQQMMADKLGVSQRTVASWEGGDRMPAYETLLQISGLYEVSTDYLLGRTNHPDFYRHHITLPSGETFTLLSNRKDPPTEEEKAQLHKAWKNASKENVAKNFPDVDPDQLQAFDTYIRQVVRSELNEQHGDS